MLQKGDALLGASQASVHLYKILIYRFFVRHAYLKS